MFKPVEENEQVYKKVMTQIQDLIIAGELKRGDRLPSERQLAETMGVGRPALRQALSALEALGVVQSRHGEGNFIAAESLEVFNPLAVKFHLDKGNPYDILEFRYLLEVQLASLAALKITDEQIVDFAALIEEMKDVQSVEMRQHYNNLFHMRVTDICDNSLIKSIYESILGLVASLVQSTDGERFYESHKLIFGAIKSRDPQAAANYTAEHFERKFPNYQYYDQLRKL